MSDRPANPISDQHAAAARAAFTAAGYSLDEFVPVDRSEFEHFVTTDPSPEQAQAWWQDQVRQHLQEREALAQLEEGDIA